MENTYWQHEDTGYVTCCNDKDEHPSKRWYQITEDAYIQHEKQMQFNESKIVLNNKQEFNTLRIYNVNF